MCSPSEIGGVALYDPLFVDRLPAEATFTGAQGVEGVDWDYDPVEHAVTYYITPNPVPVGGCVTRQITMTYDAIPADPIQENRLEVTGLPDGCQYDPAQDYCDPDDPLTRHVLTDSNFFEVVAPFGGWGISKDARSNSDFIDSEALRGEQITYDINARNGGFLPLGNVVITDVIPAEVVFDQVTFAPQPLAATITAYYLLPGDPTPIPFPAPGPTYATTATVTLADLGLAPDTEIEAIRWEVEGEIPPQSPNWRAVMLATVRGMDPIPTPPYFQNCVQISGVFTDTETTPATLIPYDSSDCAFTEIVDRRSIPRIEKSRTTAALAYPEDTVGYEMRVFNSPAAHLNAINPVAMDLLPASLDYVADTFTVTAYSPLTLTLPTLEAIPNYNGTGRTLLRARFAETTGDYELPPGASVTLAYQAYIPPGTTPSPITNTAALLTEDNPLMTLKCSDPHVYVDDLDLNGNGDFTETGCFDDAQVAIGIQLSAISRKLVRGQFESDFSEFGRTTPAGTAEYSLVLTNTSNVSLTNISIVDKLPHLGDSGVIDPSLRQSDWRPVLQTKISSADSDIPITVWYSAAENSCRHDLVPSGPANCTKPDWSLEPPINPITFLPDVTMANSVRINFCEGGEALAPTGCYSLPRNEVLALNWTMVAPSGVEYNAECELDPVGDNCPVAWNSFAFSALGMGLRFRASEPPKVGIGVTPPILATLGDYVWLDVQDGFADGIQSAIEAGINGVNVYLLGPEGDDTVLQSRVTGTDAFGNNGYYQFPVEAGQTYRVAFGIPTGAQVSPALQGSNVFSDSNGINLATLPELGPVIITGEIDLDVATTEDFSIDQGFWYPSDFGDAPYDGATYHYPTTMAGNPDLSAAARHLNQPGSTLRLGTNWDDERDGQQSLTAMGDDLAAGEFVIVPGGLSDEDGITWASSVGPAASPTGILTRNAANQVTVSATVVLPLGISAYLQAWIDYNQDGDWDDAGEQVLTDRIVTNGTQNFSITVPASAQLGATYARFRLSSVAGLGAGGAAFNGEVEDYRVQIVDAGIKSIVATSESHTPASVQPLGNNTQLAIGEIVRYRLQVQLPRGELTNFRIVDALPTGLEFLPGNVGVVVTATNPGLITGNLGPVVTVGAPVSGGDPTFSFGTLVNNNTGAGAEFLHVEFNALVRNETANQDNTAANTRRNNFTLFYNNYERVSNNIDVLIVEPVLTQNKSLVSPPPVDAGNVVTYTMVTTAQPNAGANQRRATAFDVVISDAVDSALQLDLGSIVVTPAGGATGITNNSSGNLISIAVESMPPGATVTVRYRATVRDAATVGRAIPNLVRTTWTSLPGPNGTTTNPTGASTPGGSGSATGERNGTTTPSALNNYVVTANAPLTLATPAFVKLPTPQTRTIGENATFTLVVTTTEGTLLNAIVTDALPAGLRYVSHEVITQAALSDGLLVEDYPVALAPTVNTAAGDGNDITWNFGTIVNPGDNNTTNNRFIIRIVTVVENVLANQHGVARTNGASLQYTSGQNNQPVTIDGGTARVDIIEPVLQISKQPAMSAPNPDAGDLVTYTLVVQHAAGSTIPAYESVITDTLPAALVDISVIGAEDSTGAPIPVDLDGQSLRIPATGSVTILPTDAITVVYTARLADSIEPGVAMPNTAGAIWATLPSGNPDRRDSGAPEPDSEDLLGGGALNDYEVNTTASIMSSAAYGILKTLVNSSAPHTSRADLTIGESVTYTLRVTMTEGTLTDVTVTDLLPAGLRLVAQEVITDATPALGLDETFAGAFSAPGFTATENTLVWDFGTVVNPGDNDPDNNVFLIRIEAVVENILANQHGETLTNRATLQVGARPPLNSNVVDVFIVEPTLAIDKRVETATPIPDAGDVVTYTIVVRHTAPSITAMDVVISDQLPAELENFDNLTVTSSTGAPIAGSITGWQLDVPATGSISILPTETITIAYTAELSDSVGDDDLISNLANVTWASLPDGANDDDRRTDGDGLLNGGGLNDYEVRDGATFSARSDVGIAKALINSNATHTADPDLTIGESVTYTLRVTMTEGTLRDVTVTDLLPAGLRLVAQEVITDATPALGLDETFPGTFSAPGFAATGNTLVWDFGNIVNPGDNNPDNNAFLIRIEAVVENILANQQGATLTNGATLEVDGRPPLESNEIDVTIVEPTLEIEKRVQTATANPDAGDTVTYTIVVRHTAPSITAMDVVISDTLPAALDNYSEPIVTSSAGAVVTAAPISAGLRVPATGSISILPTETITIVFTAEVSNAVVEGTTILNNTSVTWASLPDGLNDDDRRTDGDGPLGGGGLNDYEEGDDASFVTGGAIAISKHLIESDAPHTLGPNLTIGESVTYTLRITMSEGTWNNASVTDMLPAGLRLVDQEVITDATPALGLAQAFPGTFSAPGFTATGNTLAWNLGTVVNPGDNNPDNNVFLIRIQAVVENILANQQGETLTNGATLEVDGRPPLPSNPVDVNLVEPALTISKGVQTATPNPDAGDPITYTVVVRHATPSIDAFDVLLTDTLPVALDNIAIQSVTAASGAPVTAAVNGQVLRLPATGTLTLLATDAITVVYTAEVADNVVAGAPVVNTAGAIWATLPDTFPDRRDDGTGNPDGEDLLDGGALNDYEVNDSATFTPGGGYAISKTLAGTSAPHTIGADVTIGEVITYSLVITMSEGSWHNVVITDAVPVGLAYIPGSVVVNTTGFGGALAGQSITGTGGSGADLGIRFSSVVVTGDNDPTNNRFTISYRALVLNVPTNVGLPGNQNDLINGVALQAQGFPPVPGGTTTVTVVEPRMEISKEITPTITTPQGIVTVTLVISNTGLSTAFETTMQDLLPAGLTYAGGLSEVAGNGASAAVLTSSAEAVLATWATFPISTTSTLQFFARVTAAAVPGVPIINTATVNNATTLPGDDPNERTEPGDEDSAQVDVITHDLTLLKSNGVDEYMAGGVLSYTLSYANIGAAVAPGVQITDTVPNLTSFNAAGSTPGWMRAADPAQACADGDPAGTVCVFTLGNLPAGAAGSVIFSVRVTEPLPVTPPTITNTACIADNGTLGVDPTPENNCASDEDPFLLAQLGDRVWLDQNGNGIQDQDEPGMAGRAVELYLAGTDTPIAATTTNALGHYYFTNLPPAAYQVRFEVLADPRLTLQHSGDDATIDSDADRTTGFTQPITLTVGMVDHTIDAGYYYVSALGDFVWHDRNANGLQESGEPGIEGVEVLLLRSGVVISTTTTNGDGYYLFSDLDPGIYAVQVNPPAGWHIAPAKVGADDTIDSDIDPATQRTREIVIDRLVENLDLDAGLHQLASLGDRTWHDANANGLQDAGEAGMPEVVVSLIQEVGGVETVVMTTTTNANGEYLFTGLMPGAYRVRFTPPAGLNPSARYQGAEDIDSNADPVTGLTDVIVLASGEENRTIDAGYYRGAALGSYVWLDLNGDGIRDEGEPPSAGITVRLFAEGTNELVATVTTDAMGNFLFTNTTPGRYYMEFTLPSGHTFTVRESTDDRMRSSDVDPATGRTGVITAIDNTTDLTWGAGILPPPTVDKPTEEPDTVHGYRMWLPAVQAIE